MTFSLSIPSAMRWKDSFFEMGRMKRRDERLKESQRNAEKCRRELRRDRSDLEQREKELMIQIRAFAKKGELYKAKLTAQQIAHYRNLCDKNFERDVMIGTRAQIMKSNHKISKAEIQAIKGIRYANIEENIETARHREQKYFLRMEEYEMMECILNDGLDEIYEDAEESRSKYQFFDLEVDSILKEAMGANREVYDRKPLKKPEEKRHRIEFKLFTDTPETSTSSSEIIDDVLSPKASIYVSSLELSVDLLRRELLKDSFALYQLNLISPEALLQSVNTSTAVVQNPIRMGTTLSDPENPSQIRFIPFDNTKSLREIGIKDGSSIFIREIVSNVAPSPSVNIITTSNTNTNKDDQK